MYRYFIIKFILLLPVFSFAEFNYRQFTKNLITNYQFKMEDSHDHEKNVTVSMYLKDFLDPKPYLSEVNIGNTNYIEFYDRAELSDLSTLKIGERTYALTCFWVKGSHAEINIQETLLLQKVYFVIENKDCTGPILEDGNPRWESYIELQRYNPYTRFFKKGILMLNGREKEIEFRD